MWDESVKDRDFMILKDMILSLELQGYVKVNINVEGLYLYGKTIEQASHFIFIEDGTHGLALTKEQHDHILDQVANRFINREEVYMRDRGNLLSIILTEDVTKVKGYKNYYGPQWYVDVLDTKLIIYEDEPMHYYGFEKTIEEILNHHDNSLVEKREVRIQSWKQREKLSLRSTFTLCNTIILTLNIGIFILCSILYTDISYDQLTSKLGISWTAVLYGHEYFRLFTYMFLHLGFDHLFNNMLVLYYVGHNLEKVVGKVRYLILYLGSGVIAGLASLVYNKIEQRWWVVSIGASGAIFGLVGAFSYVLLIHKGRCRGIQTRQMILFILLSLYGGITASNVDNAAHIGGFIGGFILALLIYRKNKKVKTFRTD